MLLILLVFCNTAFAADFDCRNDEGFFAVDENDWNYIKDRVGYIYGDAEKYRADYAFVSDGEAYTESKNNVPVDTRFFNYRYDIKKADMYIGVYCYDYREGNIAEITMRYYSDSDEIVPEFVKADNSVIRSSDISGATIKKYENGLKELTLTLDKSALSELAFFSRDNNRVEVLSPTSTKGNLIVSSVSIGLGRGDYGVMRVMNQDDDIIVADAEIKNSVDADKAVIYSNKGDKFTIISETTDKVSVVSCEGDYLVTIKGRSIDAMDSQKIAENKSNAHFGIATGSEADIENADYADAKANEASRSELTDNESQKSNHEDAAETDSESNAETGTTDDTDSEMESGVDSEADPEIETDIEERDYLDLEDGASAIYSDSYIFADSNSPYVYTLVPSELGTEFCGNIFATPGVLGTQDTIYDDPMELLGSNVGDIYYAPDSMRITVANNVEAEYAGELSFASACKGGNGIPQFYQADGNIYEPDDCVVDMTDAFLKKASYCAVDEDDIICAVYNRHGRLMGMADGYTEDEISRFVLLPVADSGEASLIAEVTIRYNDVLAENGTYASLDYVNEDGEYAPIAAGMNGFANYEDIVEIELSLNQEAKEFSYSLDEENLDVLFDGFGEYELRCIGRDELESEADANATEELRDEASETVHDADLTDGQEEITEGIDTSEMTGYVESGENDGLAETDDSTENGETSGLDTGTPAETDTEGNGESFDGSDTQASNHEDGNIADSDSQYESIQRGTVESSDGTIRNDCKEAFGTVIENTSHVGQADDPGGGAKDCGIADTQCMTDASSPPGNEINVDTGPPLIAAEYTGMS